MTIPPWTTNPAVVVFSQDMTSGTINAIVQNAYNQNGGNCNHGQFSNNRYAFLFKPGLNYHPKVSVPVGYYTSVMGLGNSPDETVIPNVYCQQGCINHTTGALDTFWRSAENFNTPATRLNGIMEWAVSQACPLRRVNAPNIQLWSQLDGSPGFASGGFMADCNISGKVDSGPQQQWMSRNCKMNWKQGNGWNMVFVGCTGEIPAPTHHTGGTSCAPAFSVLSVTPTPMAEKPFITFENDQYYLRIPNAESDRSGPTENFDDAISVQIPLPNQPGGVYVVSDPASATVADEINTAIAAGKHIILTPGIYDLKKSITVTKAVTILGIGFPTLITKGTFPCMVVSDNLSGVRIAGILFQAGAAPTAPSTSLLQWGTPGFTVATGNYSFLYDCFARVGGPADPSIDPVSSTLMVQINNGNVIGDNLWLWRADHWEKGNVTNGDNPCQTGLQVFGDGVSIYGLAVEHTLQDLTQWYGDNGLCCFYQSELPYDVVFNTNSVGYRAAPISNPNYSHTAYGIGVYSVFFEVNQPVLVLNGIFTESTKDNSFTNAFTLWLAGPYVPPPKPPISTGIISVINGCGKPVTSFGASYVGLYPPCPQIEEC